MEFIRKYFPNLPAEQQAQFEALYGLYNDWNSKINVISRKDIQNLYLHHVLHSLAIAKYIHFVSRTTILDVGTGGGFPGVPLAVFFPQVHFTMLDSIGKKIKVASEISRAIGLQNVEFVHSRMEDEKRKFDFVVSRAVMTLPELVAKIQKNISPKNKNALPNGLISLKGGDLAAETSKYKKSVEITALSNYFKEPFFETKQLIYLPLP